MPIEPDTKNWTWVLERSCPECRADASRIAATDVAGVARAAAAEWGVVLRSGPAVRQRPAPSVWSPLEYGCHARDVNRVFDERLTLMLLRDHPLFPNWDQDETAAAGRYADQDPGTVAAEIAESAAAIADHFDTVHGEQWQRTAERSDGARFTIDSLARYYAHDVLHHLWDVTRRAR